MAAKKAHSPRNSTKIREVILNAALDVAAQEPWEFVSPLSIAEMAGVSLGDVNAYFPDKSAMVRAIIDDLDAQVEDIFPAPETDSSPRDRLFDVLMERIELANQNRAAHLSFLKAFGWTKDAACADVSLLMGSMSRMATCAGIDTGGLFGGVKLSGLALAYSWVMVTWMRDESPDLGKTMAELDRTLGRAERLVAYMNI